MCVKQAPGVEMIPRFDERAIVTPAWDVLTSLCTIWRISWHPRRSVHSFLYVCFFVCVCLFFHNMFLHFYWIPKFVDLILGKCQFSTAMPNIRLFWHCWCQICRMQMEQVMCVTINQNDLNIWSSGSSGISALPRHTTALRQRKGGAQRASQLIETRTKTCNQPNLFGLHGSNKNIWQWLWILGCMLFVLCSAKVSPSFQNDPDSAKYVEIK